MIEQLRNLGYYPIRLRQRTYDWIRRLANVYPLWMTLCCGYHLLPVKLRDKVISLLRVKRS